MNNINIPLRVNAKYTINDSSGKVLTPVPYDKVTVTRDRIFVTQESFNYILIMIKKIETLEEAINDSIFIRRKKNKVGIFRLQIISSVLQTLLHMKDKYYFEIRRRKRNNQLKFYVYEFTPIYLVPCATQHLLKHKRFVKSKTIRFS